MTDSLNSWNIYKWSNTPERGDIQRRLASCKLQVELERAIDKPTPLGIYSVLLLILVS